MSPIKKYVLKLTICLSQGNRGADGDKGEQGPKGDKVGPCALIFLFLIQKNMPKLV